MADHTTPARTQRRLLRCNSPPLPQDTSTVTVTTGVVVDAVPRNPLAVRASATALYILYPEAVERYAADTGQFQASLSLGAATPGSLCVSEDDRLVWVAHTGTTQLRAKRVQWADPQNPSVVDITVDPFPQRLDDIGGRSMLACDWARNEWLVQSRMPNLDFFYRRFGRYTSDFSTLLGYGDPRPYCNSNPVTPACCSAGFGTIAPSCAYGALTLAYDAQTDRVAVVVQGDTMAVVMPGVLLHSRATGEFVQRFGDPGPNVGQFSDVGIHDLVAGDGLMLVADKSTKRAQWFDNGQYALVHAVLLNAPLSVAHSPAQGRFFVLDSGSPTSRLHYFTITRNAVVQPNVTVFEAPTAVTPPPRVRRKVLALFEPLTAAQNRSNWKTLQPAPPALRFSSLRPPSSRCWRCCGGARPPSYARARPKWRPRPCTPTRTRSAVAAASLRAVPMPVLQPCAWCKAASTRC